MLGGAATHFALAASFFDDGARRRAGRRRLHGRGPRRSSRPAARDVDDVERVAGGKTFFWEGEYGWDLNSRETLDTQLNVFEHFEPKLSEASRAADVLFLANIQPELQLDVLEAVRGRALHRDGLDEPVDRHRPRRARRGDRARRLRDPQRRRAAPAHGEAEPRDGRARGPRVGPARRRRQAGRVRRGARHPDGVLRAAGLSAGDGRRPDRRGRHVRRRLRRLVARQSTAG